MGMDMFNYKYFFLIICLLLSTVFIHASVLEEKTLNSINAGDFVINKNENLCKSYSFSLDSKDLRSKEYLQLLIKNYIPVNDAVEINIYLNENLIKEIKNEEIKSKNIVELKNLKDGQNHLEICVENNYLPRLIINADSLVGSYYVAEIKESDFYQEVPSIAYTNTLIPINLIVKNSGFDDVFIEVINATEKFIYNSSLENVSGITSYTGILKAQEEVVLNYFVKTDQNKSFATPLAKLKYTDRFGQENIRFLKTEVINLIEQETKIQVFIDISKTTEPNKYTQGHLIIKNNSEEIINDVYITPYFNGEINITQDRISKIDPKDVIEVPFKIKTFKTDEYNLNFNVNYLSNNKEQVGGSQLINIISENKENKEGVATTILIIITIMLFIWIVKI
jgi:hypothetical protein